MALLDDRMWNHVDFSHNKSYWKRWGHDASLPFRVRNLVEVQRILKGMSIQSSLFGGTLRDVVGNGALETDHDDDLIIDAESFSSLLGRGHSRFTGAGFQVIRNSGFIVSMFRDGRYIDIHPFPKQIGPTLQALAHGVHFEIHRDSQAILDAKYGVEQGPSRRNISLKNINRGLIDGLSKARELARHGSKNPAGAIRRVTIQVRRCLGSGSSSKHKRVPDSALSLDQFLDLKIDADNSGNWAWRGEHLRVVVRPAENFRQALSRLGDDPSSLDSNVEETPLETAVEEPVALSRSFWKRGNNFFVYPFLFGFRHLVVPYHAANLYILASRGPRLYSRDYYLALSKMSDPEVEAFLRENPIEVTSGAVTSGKHRAIAMLGRIYRGESYVPVFAVTLK